MSREIKYRVWDNENKSYNDPYSYAYYALTQDGGLDFYCHGDHMDEADPDVYLVELSTGVKDKNGKEIYEGDIVEQFVCGVHQFKGKECGRKTLWQVRWNEEECCFELHYLSGSLFGDSMMSNSDEYEVIGNIHENPELLEGEE